MIQITMSEEELAAASPEDIIAAGVGLIARGMFRAGDVSHDNDPKEAVALGKTAIVIIDELVRNFQNKCVD